LQGESLKKVGSGGGGLEKVPGDEVVPGARLNFAENLLRYRDDRLAFVFKGETQKPQR